MRKIKFITNEFYHVYGRGTDKRNIFANQYDLQRFFQSMDEFNTLRPIGSLYESSFISHEAKARRKSRRLVNFIAYCLNPNHYHFILEQLVENGISQFMHRLNGGYSWYFNKKHQRSGTLFQGPFKAKHIGSNEYLLHVSAYVNLNFKAHSLGGQAAKLVKSSWKEYLGQTQENFCAKSLILKQFKNKNEYKDFAISSLLDILARKEHEKEVKDLLLE